MRFDINRAADFLKEWDAHRANRAKVARVWGVDRSHGYELADRCRAYLDTLASNGQAHEQNGPQPSS